MQHVRQIDGLRFVAISFVIMEHFAYFVGRHISAGFYGVDLFFVISGFLITSILQQSTGSFGLAYKKFIGRRTLRIFPLYYAFILIFIVAGDPYFRENILSLLTYTYNYVPHSESTPRYLNHIWSLCVEEQFYLLYPFLILSLRNHLIWFRLTLIALIAVCSAQLVFNVFANYPFAHGLFPRANSILIGCLGASLTRQIDSNARFLHSKKLEVATLLLLPLCLISSSSIRFVICPLISLFFVLKATHSGFRMHAINKFLENRYVMRLGIISYGIYLFHLPVNYYVTKYLFEPFIWDQIDWSALGPLSKLRWYSWIIKCPLYSLLTMLLAYISYKYFERPMLALKNKWFAHG